MPSLLGLPDSPRKLVFRRIVQQLRNDPTLRNCMKSILAWDGDPDESRGFTLDSAPALRLTPTCGPDIWMFPDSQRGWLYIDVEIWVPGSDVGDMLDAWWALELALYPRDWPAMMQFQADLRQVGLPYGTSGAVTGQIEFSQPAADDQPSDRGQVSRAQIKVEMRLDIGYQSGEAAAAAAARA